MPFPIRVTCVEERPPEVSQRAWRDLMREAHLDMGLHWHRTMLPRHFAPGARERYGYKVRTKNYAIAKNKAFAKGKAVAAANTDLVFTGLLRTSMQQVATVRGFPTRVTIQMSGPRYISMRPYQSNQPDKAAEVTALTPDEADELSKRLGDQVTTRLDALRQPRTTTN